MERIKRTAAFLIWHATTWGLSLLLLWAIYASPAVLGGLILGVIVIYASATFINWEPLAMPLLRALERFHRYATGVPAVSQSPLQKTHI